MPPKAKPVSETGDSYPLERKWHITRGVPLALIFTVVSMFAGQTIGSVWYFSHLDSRVDNLEHRQSLMEPQGERLTRVEEKLEGVKTGISDIKTILTAQDLRDRAKGK